MLITKEINNPPTKLKVKKTSKISSENDFEITELSDKIVKTKSQNSEVLPEWISKGIKVDNSMKTTMMVTDAIDINTKLLKALKKLKFSNLFPVQFTVIPAIINSWNSANICRPCDICVCAPTGSGKTLAYVIPILQLLSNSSVKPNGPRAIIVLPVRDLASQVFDVFEKLSKHLDLKCALLTGYKNLSKEKEDLLERSGSEMISKVDIIVCTPGRFVEHIKNTKEMNLNFIQHLVIDEADRVLEDPKHDWYLTLSKHINQNKKYKDINSCFMQSGVLPMQKILLSATLTRQPHLLENFELHYPKLFIVSGNILEKQENKGDICDNYSAPEGLKEYFVIYNKDYNKIIFIVDQIRRLKMSRILCFTNTKESAIRLNQLLNEFSNIKSAYLHCQQPPDTRQKLRHNLEQGNIDILITVDSMGRGMDIAGVRCVIQYDVPIDVFCYIHRVGRTARAGQSGLAYALVSTNQIFHLKKNLNSCGRVIKNHKFNIGKCYKYLTEYNAVMAKLQESNAQADCDLLD